MPTAYYNKTNRYVMELVDEKNIEKLNEYLDDAYDSSIHDPISTCGASLGPWISASTDFDDKIYDILSYAVQKRKIKVIKEYVHRTDCFKSYDGNTFSLMHLALYCYSREKEKEEKEEAKEKALKVIRLLAANHGKIEAQNIHSLNYYLRRYHLEDDHEVIAVLCTTSYLHTEYI